MRYVATYDDPEHSPTAAGPACRFEAPGVVDTNWYEDAAVEFAARIHAKQKLVFHVSKEEHTKRVEVEPTSTYRVAKPVERG